MIKSLQLTSRQRLGFFFAIGTASSCRKRNKWYMCNIQRYALSLCIAFLAIGNLAAQRHIAENKARDIAAYTLKTPVEKCFVAASNSSESIPSQEDCFYIFNSKSGKGFAIVSGYDCLPDILGYSPEGSFDIDNIPPNMEWLLEYYRNLARAAEDGKIKNKIATRSEEYVRTAIEPLVKVQWGQDYPYNKYCPTLGNGNNAVTGCVATAMAQIMYTLKWPQTETTAIPAYSYNGKVMPELPPTSFDWDHMTEDDIARLMLYCGQANEMTYGYQSGATDTPDPYINYFGYSRSAVDLDSEWYDDNQWKDILYANLSNGLPVAYFGRGVSGHAFIIDGFRDDMFHVNWGWDGSCDGYYHLYGLEGDGFYFSSVQKAIAYIRPGETGMNATHSKINVNGLLAQPSSNQDKSSPYEARWSLTCDLTDVADIHLGMALCGEDGTVIKILTDEEISVETLGTGDTYTHTANIIFGDGISDGKYKVMASNKMSDDSEWHIDTGSEAFYIDVEVADGKIEIAPVPYGVHQHSYVDIGDKEIDGITYHLYYNQFYFADIEDISDKFSGVLKLLNTIEIDGVTYHIRYSPSIDNNDNIIGVQASVGLVNFIKLKNLKSIEFLNGVEDVRKLDGLGNKFVKELTFPNSCKQMRVVTGYDSLETIRIESRNEETRIYIEPSDNDWLMNLPCLKDIYLDTPYPPVVVHEDSYDPIEQQFILAETPLMVNPDIAVHIPKGSLASYKKTQWSNWNLVDDIPSQYGDSGVAWDYCGEMDLHGWTSSRYWMAPELEVEFAIKLPSEAMSHYEGCEISKIEYYQPPYAFHANGMYEIPEYVFISGHDTDYHCRQAITPQMGGWNTIELEKPYKITDEDIYIGIGRKDGLFVKLSKQHPVTDGLFYRFMGDIEDIELKNGVWYNDNEDAYAIRAVISGRNVPSDVMINGVGLDSISETRAELKPVVKVRVKNISADEVNHIDFDVKIDGGDTVRMSSDASIAPNREQIIYLDYPEGLDLGRHSLDLQIAKVNGKDDTIGFNTSSGHVEIIIGVPVEYIELNQTSITMLQGEEFMLTATVGPDDAFDNTLTWYSRDTSVADVDTYGKVTAKGEGKTQIVAMANDGCGAWATCDVQVLQNNAVWQILDNCSEYDIYDVYGRLIGKKVNKDMLDSLSSGIYLLTDGTKTFKIMR